MTNQSSRRENTHMRAVVLKGIRELAVEDQPIPELGPQDVLVKNMRSGICGSDTGAYLNGGENLEPGHATGRTDWSRICLRGRRSGR